MADVMRKYTIELFTEYAIGHCFIFLRFFTRWKVMGLKGMALDDLFLVIATIFWALYTSLAYATMSMPTNVTLTPETAEQVPEEQIPAYEKGSKILFAVWYMYITFSWSIKAVALSFFARVADGLPTEMLLVRIMSIFAVLTYLVSILTHTLGCLPVSHSWQITPYPGDECTSRSLNYYVIGTLNPFTDLLCCLIPIPILWKLQGLSWRRKLLLFPLFFSGLFVMVASILRSVYSLQGIDQLMDSAFWTSRETFVAVVTVCIPGIKPLFSFRRRGKGSYVSGGGNAGGGGGFNGGAGATIGGSHFELGHTGPGGGGGMGGGGGSGGNATWRIGGSSVPRGARKLSSHASDEDRMINKDDEIQVTTEFSVSRN